MTASSFDAVIRSAQKNLACALDLTQQFNFSRLVMRSKRCHLSFEMHPVRESALRFLPFLDLRLLACWGSNGAVSFASGSAQRQQFRFGTASVRLFSSHVSFVGAGEPGARTDRTLNAYHRSQVLSTVFARTMCNLFPGEIPSAAFGRAGANSAYNAAIASPAMSGSSRRVNSQLAA